MSARAIEVHNGYVTFSKRGVGIVMKADRPAVDIDASPEEGLEALGTMSVLRVRGNVKNTDVTGELRVVNIQARPAMDIGSIDGINLECEAKAGADISSRFAMIRGKMETPSEGGTIAKLVGMDIAFAMTTAPTYGAGIAMYSQGGQVLDYGIDFTNEGSYSLNPDKAEMRLSHDVCILVGSGAPTDGAEGTGAGYAGPGSLYIDYTASTVDNLYSNEGTKTTPDWENFNTD